MYTYSNAVTYYWHDGTAVQAVLPTTRLSMPFRSCPLHTMWTCYKSRAQIDPCTALLTFCSDAEKWILKCEKSGSYCALLLSAACWKGAARSASTLASLGGRASRPLDSIRKPCQKSPWEKLSGRSKFSEEQPSSLQKRRADRKLDSVQQKEQKFSQAHKMRQKKSQGAQICSQAVLLLLR